MVLQDLIEEITFALLANKARSGLTVLGIVIGIASVISMIAIGTGSQSNIQASIQSLVPIWFWSCLAFREVRGSR